jgi:hypothetical protein
MKFEVVYRETDDAGKITEKQYAPVATSYKGLWCGRCAMERESEDEAVGLCGYCGSILEEVDLIICPDCDEEVPSFDVFEHWGSGCGEF